MEGRRAEEASEHDRGTWPTLYPFDLRSVFADRQSTISDRTVPATLSGVSTRCRRTFLLASPFAPALRCVGADVALCPEDVASNDGRGLSATGSGETLEAAATACLGEAADLLSQFERDGDVVSRMRADELSRCLDLGWMAEGLGSVGGSVDCVGAVDARSGRVTPMPADVCLRRATSRRILNPVGALSSGVAAASDQEGAALRAVLELCERDALAMWWMFGQKARRLSREEVASEEGLSLVSRLRQGASDRVTRLLDITTDLAVPTIAAISTNVDGVEFACGAAARLDAAEAARAAVLELCQMELSAPVALMKLAEGGDGALNDADRRHLRRAAASVLERLPLDDGDPEPSEAPNPPRDLAELIERLHEGGVRVYLLDLSRTDLGVPVVRAVAPELQPYVSDARTRRAKRVVASSGLRGPPIDVPLF